MGSRLLDVDGLEISVHHHVAARSVAETPLLVALHGGTYTSAYFEIAGGPLGSFVDIAGRNGFDVLTVDRPGYGRSSLLAEEDNTFPRQAELLDAAMTMWGDGVSARPVVLVGHSIGGMIALEIAARQPSWPLVGVSATGMGARNPVGGAADRLGGLPMTGLVDLPVEDRDRMMFGPEGSFSEQGRKAAQSSYAPVPFVELALAPRWAKERLASVAPRVTVPVHNVLAEFDALWDTSDQARADFVGMFDVPVSASVAQGVGHSLDHHTSGATVHLQQLAFAYECVVAYGRSASG